MERSRAEQIEAEQRRLAEQARRKAAQEQQRTMGKWLVLGIVIM